MQTREAPYHPLLPPGWPARAMAVACCWEGQEHGGADAKGRTKTEKSTGKPAKVMQEEPGACGSLKVIVTTKSKRHRRGMPIPTHKHHLPLSPPSIQDTSLPTKNYQIPKEARKKKSRSVILFFIPSASLYPLGNVLEGRGRAVALWPLDQGLAPGHRDQLSKPALPPTAPHLY